MGSEQQNRCVFSSCLYSSIKQYNIKVCLSRLKKKLFFFILHEYTLTQCLKNTICLYFLKLLEWRQLSWLDIALSEVDRIWLAIVSWAVRYMDKPIWRAVLSPGTLIYTFASENYILLARYIYIQSMVEHVLWICLFSIYFYMLFKNNKVNI